MNKEVNDWELFQRFLNYVRPHWKSLAIGMGTVPFSIGATLLLPWLIIRIIDDHVIPGDMDGLMQMVVLMGGAVTVGYFADSIYTFTLQKTGQLAISAMRSDLYAHILSMPRSFFDQRPIGVVLTRLTSDMEALNDSLAIGVLSIFTDFLKTIALLILLITLSWKLTLVVLLILPPIYLVSNFLRTRLRHYYNLTREALADATGYLQECLNGVKTIQLYASEVKVQKFFEEKTKHFFKAQSHSNFYDAALFSVIEGITSIALGLMIWYGSQQILAGIVSIGVLVGFINTLNRIFIPIREFTQQISVFQRSLSSLENVDKLFREIPEDQDTELVSQKYTTKELLERFQNFEELSFESVHFRYTEDDPWVLQGVSFNVCKGDRVAIVGATGSGKSTIVRILTRIYTRYEGSIKINGVELNEISRDHLLRMIALMQQESYLFEESISFNIALNRPEISPEKIRKAAEYVYAHEFIKDLLEQYEYKLLEGGKNLSEGQGRLIVFARALAGESDLIVLDEATSSVDSVTENLIQKAIERIFHDKTVIAIAHRLSTIRNSDLILVMDSGKIVERGSHGELMGQNGIYAGLVETLEKETEPEKVTV
ncbi:MAG TPA: ABC transporter ATP-binding protein [Candidatus Lambdaproteobacteria bacterium]|nr:ABC transporter ATP-binding protein [Candidatus Lambdaproteobacteria bacterium]HIN48803.1 ABC transporter ATP-binding protein [Deltaproteobacteria bacterium]HIA57447.1 ABC transporter ATP-binding protein [Candidatus Lambdaproteobacteria bacterium]HIB44925.1 ABC transporter ATP-binding protein [Candidatus Lambdaproteobacteria bacterium]HIB94669.1 ABC transporter ATP-binding protein [Candidatus Lambdaproteobacteria bacterium]